MKIKIDAEFAALIPSVPAEQDGELEAAVLTDGRFLNPFILWKHQNTMLDGHRRYKLHLKHPHLKVPAPIVLEFESRQEAHNWIIDHQLSKRNISDNQRRYLIGKKYASSKPSLGRPENKSATVADFSTAENKAFSASDIAEREGISERSVHNAAKFAEAVDAVAEVAPEVKDRLLSGELKGATKDLEALAELPKRQQEKAATAITTGKAKSVGAAVKAAKPKRGEPKVDVRCFSDLESQIGKAIRANTTCKEKCGGAKYHEQIRQLFNEALKVLAEWRKSAA